MFTLDLYMEFLRCNGPFFTLAIYYSLCTYTQSLVHIKTSISLFLSLSMVFPPAFHACTFSHIHSTTRDSALHYNNQKKSDICNHFLLHETLLFASSIINTHGFLFFFCKLRLKISGSFLSQNQFLFYSTDSLCYLFQGQPIKCDKLQ